jgi:acyl-coenzyme A synthetase/AMP-(fatty) acid ligase/acyl carrier protein
VLPRRWLVLGGESCSWDLVKQVQSGSGKCAIFNHYGPTETTVGVTTHMIGEKVVAGTKSPPIGRPIPNASIYLLDHRGEPVPVWASGELYIGGWAVARGYLNQPELTAERFLPDPFSDDANARLYRTGDLARYLSDGSIEFLGRADDQVKLGGFRVEPAEVESALSQHPGVAELAVTVREDSSGEKRLVAYLVFGTSKPADAELRAFLAERLPDYMLPSSFVRLGALPRLPSGKVDRGALPAPSVGSAADEGKEPSMTPMEELISEIWKEVLELDHVGVHDNFYDLGGHSLLAMQVVSTIEKQTGVWLSPREMIFQTLRQIAAVCESRLSPGSELEAGN